MADSPFSPNLSRTSSHVNRNLLFQDASSPFQAPNSPENDNLLLVLDSPWSSNSLTLPPLNPLNSFSSESDSISGNVNNVAPVNNFDPGNLSWSQNPNPFANLHSQPEYEPPPSNQERRQPVSQYRTERAESTDLFETFFDLPETLRQDTMPRPRTNVSTRSSVVDLTESSPLSSSRKRKAESPGVGRASKPPRPSSSSSGLAKVEVVDLADVENEAEYEALKAKQQEEQTKAQNQADATKPVKLSEFQCIICMDNPTDLTVTHCGMYPVGHLKYGSLR